MKVDYKNIFNEVRYTTQSYENTGILQAIESVCMYIYYTPAPRKIQFDSGKEKKNVRKGIRKGDIRMREKEAKSKLESCERIASPFVAIVVYSSLLRCESIPVPVEAKQHTTKQP